MRLPRPRRIPIPPVLIAGVIAGVAAHATALVWLGASRRLPAPPAEGAPFVAAAPPTSAGRDYADLLDPSPLFLPTRLNHGAALRAGPPPAPESPPLPVAPRTEPAQRTALAARNTPELAADGAVGASVADTFAAFHRRLPAPVTPGRARCRIEDGLTRALVLESDLPSVPPDSRDLAPAEFRIEVDAFGARPAEILRGTGDESRDSALAAAVTAALAGKRPAPGEYRAIAAP